MKKILALILSSLVAGCATTAGLGPQTSTSDFDGTKSVAISPHGAACKSMICPALGATWLDNQPNNVGFSVQVLNQISNIHSVAFNIDGEIIKLDAKMPTDFVQNSGINTSITSIMTNYSVLTKILQSKRTWMKVSTNKGAYEVAIIDGDIDSKAFHALKRFNTQVEEAKAK